MYVCLPQYIVMEESGCSTEIVERQKK